MALQRAALLAAAALLSLRDASGFTAIPSAIPSASRRSLAVPTTTSVRAEPSASEKAAELRKKAEEAKKRAEELKKVAEKKAEAAMVAVKKASEKADEAAATESAAAASRKPTPPPSKPEGGTSSGGKASSRAVADAADGAIIPVNRETIEFTSGVLGGALALALGASPVFAVVAAAAANYVSKKDDLGEINELVQALSRASLDTFNWFAKLDSKYSLIGSLSSTLDRSINDLKNSESESAETVKKIEETVSKTTRQIQQLAEEIDLLEGSKQALGAVGEVLESGIDKAVDANKQYKLAERATGAAKKALEKAKDGGGE